MKTKEYKLLIDYCLLNQIPFSVLDKEERDIVANTVGFQLFVLKECFCSLFRRTK